MITSFPKNPPVEDKEYLAYIRTLPCMIYTDGIRAQFHKDPCYGEVWYHHIHTEGKNVKCSDYETVPLCIKHHTPGVHSIGKKTFSKKFGIDMIKKAAELKEAWIDQGNIIKEEK